MPGVKRNDYIFLLGVTILVLACQLKVYAQKAGTPVYPSVIGAAGGSHTREQISLEWTVGESFVEGLAHGNRWYTQGFHQPLLYVSPFGSKEPAYALRIFPNPAHDILNLSFQIPAREDLNVELVDVTGRRILRQDIPPMTKEWKLALHAVPEGIYLLSVINQKGYRTDSFKIIKL